MSTDALADVFTDAFTDASVGSDSLPLPTFHNIKLSCVIKHVKQNVSSHNLVTDKSIILRLGWNFLSTKLGLFLSLGKLGTNLSRILSSIQHGLLTELEVKVAG